MPLPPRGAEPMQNLQATMHVPKELKIGIVAASVMHTKVDEFDLDTRFRMVKEAGVFDYIDKTPSQDDYYLYLAAQKKYGLPMLAGGWYYRLGRDEPLLEWHLRLGRQLGQISHNVQIFTHDIDGN